MFNYREEKDLSKENKIKYVGGIESVIKSREREAAKKRSLFARDILSDPERYRVELSEMLGWPLVGYEPDGLPGAKIEKLAEEERHDVYRMSFEILEGLNMSGLLYKVRGEGEYPLSIVQHGGQGTPEHIAGFYGDTTNYNDMLARVAKQGIHVFAPQLLLWKDEYEVAFERWEIDARLKRVGSSITAIEVFGIKRILDYFEKQDYVSALGMVGLSYGGFYTLFTAALDTRIKSAISCAFFNTRDEYGWPDWCWKNSAERFDDAEIACLVYPRKLRLAIADKDPLFNYTGGEYSFERVKEICTEVGCEWVDLKIFDGVHEFFKDDEPIERFASELKK